MLPSGALQLGHVIIELRKTDAEVADERPTGWHVQNRCDGDRVKNRYPAQTQTRRSGGEPKGMHGHHRRIGGGLWHGSASQALSLLWVRLGEYRQVAWGFVKASQLKARIEDRTVGVLAGEGPGVAGFETRTHGCPARGIVNGDES